MINVQQMIDDLCRQYDVMQRTGPIRSTATDGSTYKTLVSSCAYAAQNLDPREWAGIVQIAANKFVAEIRSAVTLSGDIAAIEWRSWPSMSFSLTEDGSIAKMAIRGRVAFLTTAQAVAGYKEEGKVLEEAS